MGVGVIATISRRAFVARSTALILAPLAAGAQPAGKVYRIGILSGMPKPTDAGFKQWTWVLALRDLG